MKYLIVASLLLAGCSAQSVAPHPIPRAQVFQKQPLPFQKGCCWTYTYLAKGYGPSGITTDQNHKVWVTSDSSTSGNGTLTKIAMSQKITTYKLNVNPGPVVLGLDGNFWMTTAHGISMVTPDGQETDYPIDKNMYISYIVNGSDGALWFSECSGDYTQGGVGRIDTQGNYTFYPVDCVSVITSGPDGNLWFADITTNAVYSVYSMNTKGQLLGKYPLGTANPTFGMIAGDDGNLYVASETTLSRVSTQGVVTDLGNDGWNDTEKFLVNGPDGNLWIAGDHLLIYDTKNNVWVARIKAPSQGPMVVASDSNVWSIGSNNRINTYIYMMMSVSPNSLAMQTNQVVPVSVSETNYQGVWTATSSDVNVANVTLNSQDGTFQVNAVGPGSCSILVYDSQYNSAKVKVTVD